MLAIRLPQDIEKRLAILAEQTGRTKTFYAKQAILQYLDDMEDQYIALQRLEEPSSTTTLDDLEEELDLDN
ncbi:MAG: TraY domain-containing protein [Gammaproteobacteria bacterium]